MNYQAKLTIGPRGIHKLCLPWPPWDIQGWADPNSFLVVLVPTPKEPRSSADLSLSLFEPIDLLIFNLYFKIIKIVNKNY